MAAETFVVAWRRLDEVPQDALPWLIGVARNVRLNLIRSQRRQATLVQALRSATPATMHLDEKLDSLGLPEAIADALTALSPTDREVLLLHGWEQLDRGEIAAVLNCSKANVSVRLHRAKRRFAQALQTANAAQAGNSLTGVTTPEGATDGCWH